MNSDDIITPKIFFIIIEFVAFILPALPNSLYTRLFILFLYFIAHCYKLQVGYKKFKLTMLSNYDSLRQ